MSFTFPAIATFVFLAIASITDAFTGKIRNNITLTMIIAGWFYHAMISVTEGVWTIERGLFFSLIGFALAFAIHFPLWALKVEKGGDAKLFLGIGAFMGWKFLIESTIWTAILYIPVGILVLILLGKGKNLLKTIQFFYRRARGFPVAMEIEPTMLRTGPIIAVGSLVAYLTELFSWLS